MPIPVLVWVVSIALTTTVAVAFADEIKEWARETVRRIINAIDSILYTVGDALANLIYEGRKYIREVKVWLFNEETEQYEIQTERQVVPDSEVPPEIKENLQRKRKIKISEIR
ncbi:MAG: hypothetical protein AAF757_02290 [Cyanobacteria bacterium P01_D01_bin.116]